jgi:DNA processing protein
MDGIEWRAWLRLLQTPGLGRAAVRRLVAAFGSPQAVLDADDAALEAVAGPTLPPLLATEPPGWTGLLARTDDWLAGSTDAAPRTMVALGDPDYPRLLLQTADPPCLLYLEGRAALLNSATLAIVGSRQPTPQGLEIAREMAAALGAAGQTIASGMALGIDAAAHAGALDAGAPSIAVVGTGLDKVYPARHRALARRLAAEGLIVSEYPVGSEPLGAHFPQRNRIIAGLARGTLVVEAALASGSLITARLAAEAGREVFAVPGSIRSLQSQGCHALIKQGAKLVESVADVLDELGPVERPPAVDQAEGAAAAGGDGAADPLLEALGHDPVSLDALQARTGYSTQALGAALLEHELAGRVARLPGQLFQRIGQA